MAADGHGSGLHERLEFAAGAPERLCLAETDSRRIKSARPPRHRHAGSDGRDCAPAAIRKTRAGQRETPGRILFRAEQTSVYEKRARLGWQPFLLACGWRFTTLALSALPWLRPEAEGVRTTWEETTAGDGEEGVTFSAGRVDCIGVWV